MSTQQRTNSTGPKLNPAIKSAMVAALAQGRTQLEVSKQFGVHRNTVNRVMKEVKDCDVPGNPLSKEWQARAIRDSQAAALRLVNLRKDPVAAGNAALKVLYGTGVLVSGSQIAVKGDVALTVSWMPVQQATIENATPLDVVIEGDNDSAITGERS